MTISATHNHLISGDFSAKDLAEACLKEIEKHNSRLFAYLEVFDDVFLQAEESQKILEKKRTDAPLLAGIPIATKDNILIKGHIASCGSRILEHYRAVYDAFAVTRLREAGAVFLGRTNMDEFAMGSSTENSAFGVTKNPYDESRVAGGSSGGSAVAVAMNGALGALGSETGGSVRQPAAFCGLVGLKPTYGAVSRSGLVAMASSFDQIGPLAKTVDDVRILFEGISAHDKKDSTSRVSNARITPRKNHQEALSVGVLRLTDEGGLDAGILKNYRQSIQTIKDAGYKVTEIEIPLMKYVLSVYYIIMPAEVSSNLARFDGVRYGFFKEGADILGDYSNTRGFGFGDEARRRILLGTYVLSSGYYDAYYNKARVVQKMIKESVHKLFGQFDVLALPTVPEPAFKIGEKTNDPLRMYLSDIFTTLANVAGIPALSVPSGNVSVDGVFLPTGIQFVGSEWSEDTLFSIGETFERQIKKTEV